MNKLLLFTTRQRSYGKVKLSVVCLSLSSWGRGSHMTTTHDALNLTIQEPPPPHMFKLVQLGPHCTATTLSRHIQLEPHCTAWSPVQGYPSPALLHHGWKAGGWHPTGMISCSSNVERHKVRIHACLAAYLSGMSHWIYWLKLSQACVKSSFHGGMYPSMQWGCIHPKQTPPGRHPPIGTHLRQTPD